MPSAQTAAEAAFKFLKRFRHLFAPASASEEFRQTDGIKTPVGDRITFARFIGGVPVLEDQITIFVDKSRAVILVNSELRPLRRVSTANVKKALDGAAVGSAAVSCVMARAGVKDADIRPALEKGYSVTKDGSAILAWRVTFDTREPPAAWEVLVEAASGRVLSVSNIAAYGK
jgi:Zn-dependent metalloprotease